MSSAPKYVEYLVYTMPIIILLLFCSSKETFVSDFGKIPAHILFTDLGPHFLKDFKSLERIQRRATKFILGSSHKGYIFVQ